MIRQHQSPANSISVASSSTSGGGQTANHSPQKPMTSPSTPSGSSLHSRATSLSGASSSSSLLHRRHHVRPSHHSSMSQSVTASTATVNTPTAPKPQQSGLGELSAKNALRKVLIIRHGERIDFTFNKGNESWVSKAFDKNGRYKRFNINMPRVLPQRKDGHLAYVLDTPLTEMGYLQAKLTGRALKDAGVKPDYVYVSPALRCVQTCVGILKGMNNSSLRFQMEPGLFEWGSFFRPTLPTWMAAEELAACGYPVNPNYVPVGPPFTSMEPLDDYYHRSYDTLLRILDKHPENCCIVLVAHGASLDTFTRQVTGGEPRVQHDFYLCLHQTPYLACAAVEEFAASAGSNHEPQPAAPGAALPHCARVWRVVEPPVLPFQHQSNASYNWRILNTELGS